jgi:hypothetical protein
MRRLAFVCLPLCALALPAAALAHSASSSDGTLVIQNASAPKGVAVMTLTIKGTVLGHVSSGSPDQKDVVYIVDANNTGGVGASGVDLTKTSGLDQPTDGTRWKLTGSDFRFRAASGVYKVWVYGSGVDLFAVGQGNVTIQGEPSSSSTPDGWYSIDGQDRQSLPAAASDLLPIASGG